MANLVEIYILWDPRNNNKCYIGKAISSKKRLQQHLRTSCLKFRTLKNNWIKSLLSKNLAPSLEVLDQVLETEWQFWERHYISLYKSWGFNLLNGDNGGMGRDKFYSHSNETRIKIGQTSKGRKAWNKGLTKQTDKKVEVNANKSLGKTPTQTTRDKMALSKRKPLIRIDLKTSEVIRYPSVRAAAEGLEIKNSLVSVRNNIALCAQGKRKSAYNYNWKYL